VYEEVLRKLTYEFQHEDTAPRGLKIHEITNLLIKIEDSSSNMFSNKVRGVDKQYLAGELLWYLSGRNDTAFITKYSSFWDKISNNDATANSAYGYQLWNVKNKHGLTEWDWAKTSLINDKDTRQSVIRFNKPDVSFEGNKDFVCTLNGVFQIRGGKLNLFINMRSSDAVLGLTYDVPFFSLLIQIMRFELSKHDIFVEPGSLTMMLNSSHVYERHFELVEEMLEHEFIEDSLPRYDEDLVMKRVDEIKSNKSKLGVWISNNSL